MMSRTLVSPEEIAIGSQLLEWAETYLMKDEEKPATEALDDWIPEPYGVRGKAPVA